MLRVRGRGGGRERKDERSAVEDGLDQGLNIPPCECCVVIAVFWQSLFCCVFVCFVIRFVRLVLR